MLSAGWHAIIADAVNFGGAQYQAQKGSATNGVQGSPPVPQGMQQGAPPTIYWEKV